MIGAAVSRGEFRRIPRGDGATLVREALLFLGRKVCVLKLIKRTIIALIVAAASDAACAGDVLAKAWGQNNFNQCNVPATLGPVIDVAGGGIHSVALRADGTVACWGYNGFNQCNVPAGLAGVVQVAAGVHFSAARRADGTVICWGDNGYAQCDVPPTLPASAHIAAGFSLIASVGGDGTLIAWGSNRAGERDVPQDLSVVADVAIGDTHVVALQSGGAVRCWGRNSEGQCTPPAGLDSVVQVSAHRFYSMALKSDGTVVQWGTGRAQAVPAGLDGVVEITSGYSHSVAKKADGRLVYWGTNAWNQSVSPADLGPVVHLSAGWYHTFVGALPDACPLDPDKFDPGVCGCGVPDVDTDGDGVLDCLDGCPTDPLKTEPGPCGCGQVEVDSDGDGAADCVDGCPLDPLKTSAGFCGCGLPETDSDGDGTPDCVDGCPSDPLKSDPGTCGCGVSEVDGDSDGVPDCVDGCPTDPLKIEPGACGCNVADTDTDDDGTPDCFDGCPTDPLKTAPGACGCGEVDADSDEDGVPNCIDGCPADRLKIAPGACGCGVPDDDSDSDGTPDCNDGCPADPTRTEPSVWYEDADADGAGDPLVSTSACAQPAGFVAVAGDECPLDAAKTLPGPCGCGVAEVDLNGNGVFDCLEVVATVAASCPAGAARPGETIRLLVTTTETEIDTVGIQLAMHFDSTRLEFVGAEPATGGPFQLEVFEFGDSSSGTLIYAIGLDENAPPYRGVASLAALDFTVLPGFEGCEVADLVWFEPIGAIATKFSGVGGVPVLPILADLAPVSIDAVPPVLSGVPADRSLPADAGSAVGAVVDEPTVTATDDCDDAPTLALEVDLPDATTISSWPAGGVFPVGTSTVTYSATDDAGNEVVGVFTVTVEPYQLLDLTVTLAGVVPGASQRSLRVTAGGAVQIVSASFSAGAAAVSGIEVPVSGGYSCIAIKDPAHSITTTVAAEIEGTRYRAAAVLRQGDSNDDDLVDAIDFALFIDSFGFGAPGGISNFNDDALVNGADFSFIAVYGLTAGDACGSFSGGEPRARISVRELRHLGLGHLAVADLNGDGWVDAADMGIFLQEGLRKGPRPTIAPPAHIE